MSYVNNFRHLLSSSYVKLIAPQKCAHTHTHLNERTNSGSIFIRFYYEHIREAVKFYSNHPNMAAALSEQFKCLRSQLILRCDCCRGDGGFFLLFLWNDANYLSKRRAKINSTSCILHWIWERVKGISDQSKTPKYQQWRTLLLFCSILLHYLLKKHYVHINLNRNCYCCW